MHCCTPGVAGCAGSLCLPLRSGAEDPGLFLSGEEEKPLKGSTLQGPRDKVPGLCQGSGPGDPEAARAQGLSAPGLASLTATLRV